MALACNCALAGTKACENCPSYKMYFDSPQYNGYTLWNNEFINIQYNCPRCGTLVAREENYCHNCGEKLRWTIEDTVLKDIKEGKGLKPIAQKKE